MDGTCGEIPSGHRLQRLSSEPKDSWQRPHPNVEEVLNRIRSRKALKLLTPPVTTKETAALRRATATTIFYHLKQTAKPARIASRLRQLEVIAASTSTSYRAMYPSISGDIYSSTGHPLLDTPALPRMYKVASTSAQASQQKSSMEEPASMSTYDICDLMSTPNG